MNRARAIRRPAAFQPPFRPGGRLTPLQYTAVIVADQSAVTFIAYCPCEHAYFPVVKNGIIVPVDLGPPVQLYLGLTSAHTASAIYDVFGVDAGGGHGAILTGPAWATPTAGSGARGSGPGTTELAWADGITVNRWGIPGLNGFASRYIPPLEGTYLGSIHIDGSNGQVSCHVSYGQSRKWGVWNAYNRRPILLRAGDNTANWSYGTNTIRASNNDANNKVTVFTGLAEEVVAFAFQQTISMNNGGATTTAKIGIGINSTSAFSGTTAQQRTNSADAINVDGTLVAFATQLPFLGINAAQALEQTPAASASPSYTGTEAGMLLTARWMG